MTTKSDFDHLTEFARVDPIDRHDLLKPDAIRAGARLKKHAPDQFGDLLFYLGDHPTTRAFNGKIKKLLAQVADALPKVHASDTRLSETIDESMAALVQAGGNLFQANGRLVQMLRHNNVDADCTEEPLDSKLNPIRRPDGALVVADVAPSRLLELISQSCDWYNWDSRLKPTKLDPDNPDKRGGYRRGKVPRDIPAFIEARGQWPFRVLRGTIEAPTLRSTGSILQRTGYDRRSRLYFDAGGVEFPPIPENPTREDALAALELLKDPIQFFPFVPDEGDDSSAPSSARSVALSAMMTALVRRTLDTAPTHAFDAPTMGTGKTKLSEIAAVLATGRTPTAISQGDTPAEFNKRLFSVLRTGDPVIMIDNISQPVESDELCTVITSPVYQGRVLGESKTDSVETNALILMNGNRISFRGDITVRVVVCGLDANMENPGDRRFPFEPVARTMEHRADLVVAGLTVMRAHVVAGYPGTEDLTPSRFPDWDRMVRAALVWLGEPDPQATAERIITVDPVRETHSALLRAWEAAICPDVWVRTKDIIERAGAVHDFPTNTEDGDEANGDLSEAIEAALGGRYPTIQGLSRYLKSLEGRIYDGLSIRASKDRKDVMVFVLKKHKEN